MQKDNFGDLQVNNIESIKTNEEIMDILCSIEKKFEKIFEIKVNGIEPYLWIRPFLIDTMMYKKSDVKDGDALKGEWKKYINFPRIVYSFFDIIFKSKNAEWIVFTSAIHRRDQGRNLVAEHYLNEFENTIILESPSRNMEFSKSYEAEPYKKKYILLDFYFCATVIWNKTYGMIYKNRKASEIKEYEMLIEQIFEERVLTQEEAEYKELLYAYFPSYCVDLKQNHRIANLLFKSMKAENYVDYSGHLFELVYPTIKDKTVPFYSIQVGAGSVTTKVDEFCIKKKIEIKSYMSNVIELVYSNIIKQLMVRSGYNSDKIRVVGNIRLKMYEKVFGIESERKDLILFISQPHGSDPFQSSSYHEFSKTVREVYQLTNESNYLKGCKIAIKLHPLENEATASFYKQTIGENIEIISDTGALYDLLKKSKVIITKNSTVAMEASFFNTPTIFVGEEGDYYNKTYGVTTVYASNPSEMRKAVKLLEDKDFTEQYIKQYKSLISEI